MIQRRRLLSSLLIAAASPAVAFASEKKKEGETAPTSAFAELPTLTAAVMKADGRRGVMTVQAILYVANPAMRVKVNKSMPLLMNAYVPVMQAWCYRMAPGRAPTVDGLGLILQKSTDGVLGPGARVLLGGVMVN